MGNPDLPDSDRMAVWRLVYPALAYAEGHGHVVAVLGSLRRLGLDTTQFLARYTEAGGTVLRTREEDRGCVFLGPRGCTVHPDRPLACRLYPLARWVAPDGEFQLRVRVSDRLVRRVHQLVPAQVRDAKHLRRPVPIPDGGLHWRSPAGASALSHASARNWSTP